MESNTLTNGTFNFLPNVNFLEWCSSGNATTTNEKYFWEATERFGETQNFISFNCIWWQAKKSFSSCNRLVALICHPKHREFVGQNYLQTLLYDICVWVLPKPIKMQKSNACCRSENMLNDDILFVCAGNEKGGERERGTKSKFNILFQLKSKRL